MYNVSTFDVKYIDFGLATLTIDGMVKPNTPRVVGTLNYLHPLLLDREEPLTFDFLKQADNFSLGMVFFKLLTNGKTVYHYMMNEPCFTKKVVTYNEGLAGVISNPKLKPVYAFENQLIEYAIENNLVYIDFVTLMGFHRPPTTDSVPTTEKGGKRRKTAKRRKRKID